MWLLSKCCTSFPLYRNIVLFEHHYCGIKLYLHTKFHFHKVVPLGRYVQIFVPIIMYGLGLFFVVITESTMFTKF